MSDNRVKRVRATERAQKIAALTGQRIPVRRGGVSAGKWHAETAKESK